MRVNRDDVRTATPTAGADYGVGGLRAPSSSAGRRGLELAAYRLGGDLSSRYRLSHLQGGVLVGLADLVCTADEHAAMPLLQEVVAVAQGGFYVVPDRARMLPVDDDPHCEFAHLLIPLSI